MQQPIDAGVRSEAYKALWGEPSAVTKDADARAPTIDVLSYAPRMDHNGVYQSHYRLVTSGMSDLPMTFPAGSTPPFRRSELVMYVAEPTEEHYGLLQFLAHYPHRAGRYYVYGHTIPNAEPFFSDSQLSVALLLQSLVRWDARLPELLQIEDQPVELLWVQPITAAELAVKQQSGLDTLLEMFRQHQLPYVLDESRNSLA